MIRKASIEGFNNALALAEMASRSPEMAAQQSGRIYQLLRALKPAIEGRELPDRIVVAETLLPVVLSTAGATTTPEIEISWPTNGFCVGIGCEVPEGMRERISFALTVNGQNLLVTKGKAGSGYAPINTLAGRSTEGGMLYMPVFWAINTNDIWRMQFTSLGAPLPAGSVPITLTPQPFFLFAENL